MRPINERASAGKFLKHMEVCKGRGKQAAFRLLLYPVWLKSLWLRIAGARERRRGINSKVSQTSLLSPLPIKERGKAAAAENSSFPLPNTLYPPCSLAAQKNRREIAAKSVRGRVS